MNNVKVKISWLEWDPNIRDDVEQSVESSNSYPENEFFEDDFGKFVYFLEEKYNVTLDGGGDEDYQEYTMADDVYKGTAIEVAKNILSDIEAYLRVSGKLVSIQ